MVVWNYNEMGIAHFYTLEIVLLYTSLKSGEVFLFNDFV